MSNASFSEINKLYNAAGFYNIYGSDYLITIVICVIFLLIFIYFSIVNNLDPIKANWDTNKCKPSVIPFAGLINKPANSTVLDFTQTNFINCTMTMLRQIVDNAFKPLYLIIESINSLFQSIGTSLMNLFQTITKLQILNTNILDNLYKYITSFSIPIHKIIISVRDFFEKIKASLVLILYSLYGPYYTILAIIDAFVDFLNILIGTTVGGLLAIMAAVAVAIAIPFIGWASAIPLLALAAATTAFLAILLILIVILRNYINDIRDAYNACFDPNTKIRLKNGELVLIKDIKLGSILKNGAVVKAVMKINNFDENNKIIHNMYKLKNGENNEDVYVTGSHLIYDNNIKEFVQVKDYCGTNVVLETNKQCNELSCLVTSDHTIVIGDMVFHDWEDINN